MLGNIWRNILIKYSLKKSISSASTFNPETQSIFLGFTHKKTIINIYNAFNKTILSASVNDMKLKIILSIPLNLGSAMKAMLGKGEIASHPIDGLHHYALSFDQEKTHPKSKAKIQPDLSLPNAYLAQIPPIILFSRSALS